MIKDGGRDGVKGSRKVTLSNALQAPMRLLLKTARLHLPRKQLARLVITEVDSKMHKGGRSEGSNS